jgi:hypothetical protein
MIKYVHKLKGMMSCNSSGQITAIKLEIFPVIHSTGISDFKGAVYETI